MLSGVGLRFNPGGEELLEGVSDKRSLDLPRFRGEVRAWDQSI